MKILVIILIFLISLPVLSSEKPSEHLPYVRKISMSVFSHDESGIAVNAVLRTGMISYADVVRAPSAALLKCAVRQVSAVKKMVQKYKEKLPKEIKSIMIATTFNSNVWIHGTCNTVARLRRSNIYVGSCFLEASEYEKRKSECKTLSEDQIWNVVSSYKSELSERAKLAATVEEDVKQLVKLLK